MKRFLLVASLWCMCAAPVIAQPVADPLVYEPGLSGFTVQVNDLPVPYRVFSVFYLPASTITLTPPADAHVAVTPENGTVEPRGQDLIWRPNEAQPVSELRITLAGQSATLHALRLTPYAQIRDGALNGYRMGEYPSQPYKGLAIYQHPEGFFEVTQKLAKTPLSPHFRVGEFTSKQSSKWPKYLILREELILKLEKILALINKAGIKTNQIHIMSGYRTPYYNRSIGNSKNSRHVYGGAADIFIDVAPKDGVMDDLNKDGKINKLDAKSLYDIIDRESRKESWAPNIGGLGRYGFSASHSPFVHVDARGFRARWGK